MYTSIFRWCVKMSTDKNDPLQSDTRKSILYGIIEHWIYH